MKITDLQLVYAKHYLFVKIYTDAGIVGLGEAGNWGFLNATAAAIEKFKPYLVGKDPFRIEDICQNLYRAQYFRGSVIMSAISAVDIALWDIKGKAFGVPVYELLGGRVRDKVRVYASVMTKEDDPHALAEGYRALQKQGFTAAKIFVNGPIRSANGGMDEFFSGRIEDELEKVRLCREAVGPHFDFVLEVHRGMTLPEAVSFGRAVEPYRPMVLEDPVPPDNIDTMAEVASKVGVPIASGERFINLREFEMLMSRHAVQYVRPDVCAVGGITTTKKICALAEAHDVLVIPHNPAGRVWERRELEQMMELFARYDVTVISDEIWSDLILPGYTHIPTQSVSEDARRRTVALYAPSKTFNLAGLIGSYHIIYDPALRDRVRRAGQQTHYNSQNVLSMHALTAAYSAEGARWLEELLAVLDRNVEYAVRFIQQHFDGVTVARPQGTYMLFPDCSAWCAAHGQTIDQLLAAGHRVGVIWQNGRSFHGEGCIRMNLALPYSRVQEAFDRLDRHVFHGSGPQSTGR